jgi:energy-converting hydrogenase Eha subunit E
MGDFSIKALTAPFVPPVQRYFDKTTKFIISKNPALVPEQVDHDVKVLMFNAATALIVSTVSLAYFRTIALVTAVALVVIFYLVRRIIDETPKRLPSETSSTLQDVVAKGWSLMPKRAVQIPVATQSKPLKERFQEFFRQDDAIVIGHVIVFKLTHYPMPTIIGMLLTRSP